MKKALMIVLALVLIVSCLSACAKDDKSKDNKPDASTVNTTEAAPQTTAAPTAAPTEAPTAAPTEAAALELEKVYEALSGMATEEGFVLFPASDDELAAFYPGLENIELKQKVAYLAPIPGVAEEVLLVEVANADDVAKVQEIFQTRIKDATEAEGCDPSQNGLWANEARVHTLGNYVGMVVLAKSITGIEVPENVFEISVN